MNNYDELRRTAEEIRDATVKGENTAEKVGGCLVGIVDGLRKTGDFSLGEVTASADNDTGTPRVDVTTSKDTEGKTSLAFGFHAIKGEHGDTGEQGIQGIQGERGEKGETGDAAGFGEIAASVDDVIGTPSVSVTTSGDNTAKNITFSFSGLKGEKGDRGEQGLKGDTGEQGIQGIQGERGEKGETGDQGLQGEQGLRGLQGERGEKGEKGDKGDKMTLADLTEDEIAELQEPAIEAAKKAETAADGAEKVNVELSGDSITVTDRNGDKNTIKVIAMVEKVTVTVTSQVEGINVSGLKVNVFLNNGKTPQTYTTNSEGECTFEVDRGSYYEVTVPEFANAQPLSPIGYTASIESREIAFDYKPYDEETSEKVIVTVTKYTDGTGAAWEGKEVKVTYDKNTTSYTTDSKGQATFYVPYLKEYTIAVENEDGYYVRFAKNTRTYTSRVPQRLVSVPMYQFKTGIFVLDSEANEYYIEEWKAAGKTSDEAVAIKIADQNLMLNRGTFLIRTSDLQNVSKIATRQWCTQQLLFESIATNGNSSKDANYWNGEQSSFLIRQEAEEKSLTVPAFDYAYQQVFEIGGQQLNGFLMSVGQEYVHVSNAGVVRDILTELYGEDVGKAYYTFVYNKWRWTSTQLSAAYAYYYYSSVSYNYKTYSYSVLPVFAC